MPRNIDRIYFIAGLLCAMALLPRDACGQSVDEASYERLEAAEVGTYRPEQTPDLAKVRQLIVDRTNTFRRDEGRKALTGDESLQSAAEEFAQYMARTDRYGHTADGNRPSGRASAAGYEYCVVAENISYQFSSRGFATEKLAEGFVTGWKNSPGHRENMLKPEVTETGVAVAQSDQTGVFYAVQMFARPRSEEFSFTVRNLTEETIQYRVADKDFSLPPRFSQTHRRCRPAEFALYAPDSPAEERGEVAAFTPRAGDQFDVVRDESGTLAVDRDRRDAGANPRLPESRKD